MTRTTQIRIRVAALAALVLSLVVSLGAQAASRSLRGVITAINGSTLTVKTDSGESHQVTVAADTDLKRIEPGQTSLSSAAAITLADLAVGDRILVRGLDADATADPLQPKQIVAIKAADMAQKQEKDLADWQKRGVAGLVKSVDAANGVITVSTGAGPTAKTLVVKTTSATILKRYAAGTVRFDQAQPAPINAIQAGDQLRARGEKNADGTEIAAEEVVSGSFRNVSGTILSVDAAASIVTLKDLTTKKQVTIHIGPDAQMHRIPDQMAQAIAARLKGTAGAGGGGQRPAGSGAGAGSGGGRGAGAGGGDPQQFLSRTPVIKISDLQKGQAIMVVATDAAGSGAASNSGDVNAVMLLAGVEPLLEAPAARDLLSSWSMGAGGDAGGGTQ
ncbi:hypothetical protein [Terracidiphilus sp.]|jgi:Copper binding periplasmic protein CusF/Domain of unknown function (DUF5666)|uniref:hypothetical protein n=1 Tax=Terracidiphilus sp. TaxID=1964191 RepID=UPI003C21F9E7